MNEVYALLGFLALVVVATVGGFWYKTSSDNEARMACIKSDKQWVENSCVFGTR